MRLAAETSLAPTVLVVDDDAPTAWLQQRSLVRRGFRVQTALDLQAAWQTVASGDVALILLDQQMPGDATGLDFLRQLRDAGNDVPAVLVTGFPSEAVAIEALRGGARDFVVKGNDYLEYLPETVERILRQVETERQLNESRARLASVIEVTRLLAETGSLAMITPEILRILVQDLGWETGALWKVDPAANILRCVEIWHVADPAIAQFAAASRQLTFGPGIGLPGRVWSDRKPVLSMDLAEDHETARMELLAAAGLRCGLCAPIKSGDGVKGVIEFIGRQGHPPAAGFLPMLESLTIQIGQLIERRQVEEQLLQSQKLEAIGRLAGGVAHDFNNLLTVITGHTSMLLDKLEEGSPQQEPLTEVLDSAYRAATLTNQLLGFSRKQLLNLATMDLRTTVEGLLPTLQRLIPGENIELRTRFDADLGRVKADADQIGQILINLAVNACEAMQGGGRLEIALANADLDPAQARAIDGARPGAYVMLSVSDTGRGMTPSTRKLIFEPYFSTKPLGRGTGLGLAMVYGVIKQTGGHVHVESEVGKGTVFRAYFPRICDDPTQAGSTSLTTADLHGIETILLVESDAGARRTSAALLRAYGYRVIEAANGISALDRFAEEHESIRLVLCAEWLPGTAGRELCRRLAERAPTLRIVLMSGHAGEGGRAEQDDGELRVLAKPFSSEELLSAVREILDAPRGRVAVRCPGDA